MNPRRGRAASPDVPVALACARRCALSALWAVSAASAADVPPPPQLAQLPAAPAAASAPARGASGAARITTSGNMRVIEDDEVRIEEFRDARGRVVRVSVHPKNGSRPYEIIVPPGGKDLSQARGAAGQSAWSVLDF